MEIFQNGLRGRRREEPGPGPGVEYLGQSLPLTAPTTVISRFFSGLVSFSLAHGGSSVEEAGIGSRDRQRAADGWV